MTRSPNRICNYWITVLVILTPWRGPSDCQLIFEHDSNIQVFQTSCPPNYSAYKTKYHILLIIYMLNTQVWRPNCSSCYHYASQSSTYKYIKLFSVCNWISTARFEAKQLFQTRIQSLVKAHFDYTRIVYCFWNTRRGCSVNVYSYGLSTFNFSEYLNRPTITIITP